MRFRKINIPTRHPWKYPSRYPYIILEGSGRTLSEDEKQRINSKRAEWRPSKLANNFHELLKNNIGKTLLLQVVNPQNYYDTIEDLPKPFIAEIRDVIIERVLDFDLEFDQLFILLSNPRHLNGDSVFKKYNYDYETLLKPQDTKDYKLNFGVVTKLSIEHIPFWKQLFKHS